MHDLMRLYYGRLFPFHEMYRCVCTGCRPLHQTALTRWLTLARASAGSPTATTQDCHIATPPSFRFALAHPRCSLTALAASPPRLLPRTDNHLSRLRPQRREFCFTLENDVFVRYQSFKDCAEMQAAVRDRQVVFIAL